MTARRIGRLALWTAALAIGTGLLLEIAVRVFAPQILERDTPDLWIEDSAIGWRHRPNAHFTANTGEREVEVCTDMRGDRVECGVAPRTDCAKRVIAIGSSYVEALSIPFRETVWSRLDTNTRACTDVAGVGAYSISQYLAQTRERLTAPGAHYDLVIVALYLVNDMTETPELVPPPMDVQRRPFRLLPAGLSESALWDWFYPWNSLLESHSHAYVAARRAIRLVRDRGDVGLYGVPRPLQPSRVTPALVEGTVRGIAEIAETAHRQGAKCLVVLIPHRSQVLDPEGVTLLRGFPELAGDIDMDLPQRELVPRLEAVRDVDRVVDLLPPLRERANRESWGTRDAHLSPAGHELWFEVMREPVRELLAAPKPE